VVNQLISTDTIKAVDDIQNDYKYGFYTEIESEYAPKGLSEEIVRFISAKKDEPKWLLDWRLKAFKLWENSAAEEPQWANIDFEPIDFQDAYYYAAPKDSENIKSLDDVDPELLRLMRSSEFH